MEYTQENELPEIEVENPQTDSVVDEPVIENENKPQTAQSLGINVKETEKRDKIIKIIVKTFVYIFLTIVLPTKHCVEQLLNCNVLW